MRLAKYFLIFIVFAILAVGIIGVGVNLIGYRPSKIIVSRKPAREVFVDIDKLVSGHPAWDALKTIDSTMGDVRAMQLSALRGEVIPRPGKVSISDTRASVGVPRWQLEATTAQLADESLQQLKIEHLMVLQGRIQASRITMLDSAEADIMTAMREIQQETAVKITEIGKRRSYDVVNLRIRAKALRSMLGKPGINDAEIGRQLAPVEAELASIEQTVQNDTQQVSEDAQSVISELRKNANEKIDVAMSAYSRTETLKIQKRIDDAQSQIMSDVVSFDELAAADLFGGKSIKPVKAKSLKPPQIGLASKYDAGGDLVQWSKKTDALKRRIRTDVVSEALAWADERNFKIVFSRKDRALPDETALFEKLMWSRGVRKGMPILYGDNGI
ncbi:MAG: hypothetical protein NT018_12455 [Armatimonadetes bacterium]|nr:hypothetical protein [Armatimonadota bacterium]